MRSLGMETTGRRSHGRTRGTAAALAPPASPLAELWRPYLHGVQPKQFMAFAEMRPAGRASEDAGGRSASALNHLPPRHYHTTPYIHWLPLSPFSSASRPSSK